MGKAAQGAEAVELDRLVFRIESISKTRIVQRLRSSETMRWDQMVISEPEESYGLEKFWFSKYGYVNNDEKYFTFSGVNGSLLMWMLTLNGMIHHVARVPKKNWSLTSWLSDYFPTSGAFTMNWEPSKESG
ncbi:hypothetical protein CsSME_00020502 [Camellia sinensis var. sinensis]